MSGTSKFLENLDVPDIFFFLFSINPLGKLYLVLPGCQGTECVNSVNSGHCYT